MPFDSRIRQNGRFIAALKKLDTLREGIDELDTQLVELLAKRNQITTQVGQIKAAGMPVYVPEREKR